MDKKNKDVFTGGSRIGSVNETFPFSKLIIEPTKLRLKTTFSGTIEISPQELIAVEEVLYVPLLAQGIKIRHSNPDHKKTLIFWSFKAPKKILKSLEQQGWLSTAARSGPGIKKSERSGSDQFKVIKLLNSPLFIIFLAAMLLFAGFVENKSRHRYDGYTRIDRASAHHIEVIKMSIDHGTVSLNDGILVSGGSKLISEKPGWFRHKNKPLFGGEYPMPPNFSDLHPPFEIIKEPDSFILQVVKWSDTLFFQIPDPDYKDPRDPSIRDVLQKLFKN